jgi:mannonate dehydratase
MHNLVDGMRPGFRLLLLASELRAVRAPDGRPALVQPLGEIRFHNPLLFDFVLKRNLSVAGKRLPPRVFETRRFFVR